MIEIVAVAKTETILDGSAHAVTIGGYVQVDAGASLALDGTIHNEGTIDLASGSGPSSNLVIQTDVTLQGCGQVTLTDGGDNAIVTNGSAVTLTNVDNTISGAGTIGDRQYLTLVNERDGTIDANISGPRWPSTPAIPSPMPARWKRPTAPRSRSTTASPIPAARSRLPTPIPWSSSSA